jgi:hypothetical protein
MLLKRIKDIVTASVNDALHKMKKEAQQTTEEFLQKYEAEEKKRQIETETLLRKLKEEQERKEAETRKTYEELYQKNFGKKNEQKSSQNATPQQAANTQEIIYYQVLELPNGANFDQIKAAYKKLIKLHHPDKFHGKPELQNKAQEKTGKLNEAFQYFEKKFQKKITSF